MKTPHGYIRLMLGIGALATGAALATPAAHAALILIYAMSISNPKAEAAITEAVGNNLNDQDDIIQFNVTDRATGNNCRAAQGCLGRRAGFVVADGADTGLIRDTSKANLVDQLHPSLKYSFDLGARKNAVLATKTGFGTLTVRASRDIGLRPDGQGGFSDSGEFVNVLAGANAGQQLGTLFARTRSNCAETNVNERKSGSNPAELIDPNKPQGFVFSLVCGPNFHTDGPNFGDTGLFGTVETLTIGLAQFQALGAGGMIPLFLNPTEALGRIKVFEATLAFFAPEPDSLGLLAVGLAGLGAALRRSRRPRPD